MKPPRLRSLVGNILVDAHVAQLSQSYDAVLPSRDSRDLLISRLDTPPPTGLKAIYISTFRPVGGVVGGSRAHWRSVAGDGAWVVRYCARTLG